MAKIKTVFVTILSVFFIGVIAYLVIANYSLLFSKTVKGMVMSVKTVELPIALMTTRNMAPGTEVFSFAVAIKDSKTKEIFTAKSEERQWAVVAPGQCVEAVFLPYPPWDLRRRGTFFGARLVSLRDCEPGLMPAPAAAAPAPAPQEPAVEAAPQLAAPAKPEVGHKQPVPPAQHQQAIPAQPAAPKQ